ncbi:response regulator transcription factor [Andreprevotia chitinilytica]|uniref:response regulator transcription factor n=1 Tax=Andreprevotia chitinilytica TaxID=396808 RepID=UPI0005536F5C|nr:response regulator transcription factor [Andreprevotia chitinilytica]
MYCLIIDDHPVALLGYTAIVQNCFPHWKILTAPTLQVARKYMQSGDGNSIGLILIGLSRLVVHEYELLASFLHMASIRSIPNIVMDGLGAGEALAICKQGGAHGYLLKNESVDTIKHAIRVVAAGGKYLSPAEIELDMVNTNDALRLTDRQKDIIDLVLVGYSNKKIADALNLSNGTVKNYMFDIMRLMGVSSRLELAIKVKESGYRPRSGLTPTMRGAKQDMPQQGMGPFPISSH